MGNLTDDYLKWTLDIDGKPAQSQLGHLDQKTKDLENTNKGLRSEMRKLEAQMRKNPEKAEKLRKEYNRLENKLKTNNRTIRTAKKDMEGLRKEVGINGLTARQLKKEYRSLKQQMDNTVPETDEWKRLNGRMGAVKKRMSEVGDTARKADGRFGALKRTLTGMVAGGAVVAGLRRMVSNTIKTRAEFEKMEAVLSNTLGSESEAQKAMNRIQAFAAKTPFQVNELTDSFIKLANQGFEPNLEQMKKLGDLASAQGKSFQQLAEAVLDAQVGEFERLKEFGIRAKSVGDQVTFTFKEQKTTVDKTSESIQDYILSLGEMEGVAGGMEAISATLAGRISNLQDKVDQFFNAIGKSSFGSALQRAVGVLGNLIGKATDFVQIPMSENLRSQKQEVNRLANELINLKKNTDDSAGAKKVLKQKINELQKVHPGFMEDIEDEEATWMDIRDRLREVNEEYNQRIQQYMVEGKIKDQKEAMQEAIDTQINYNDKIAESKQIIQDIDTMMIALNEGRYDKITELNENLEVISQKKLKNVLSKVKSGNDYFKSLLEEAFSLELESQADKLNRYQDLYQKAIDKRETLVAELEEYKKEVATVLSGGTSEENTDLDPDKNTPDFDKQEEILKKAYEKQLLILKERYAKEVLTKKQYDEKKLQSEQVYLQNKLNLYEQYEKDTSAIEMQIYDLMIDKKNSAMQAAHDWQALNRQVFEDSKSMLEELESTNMNKQFQELQQLMNMLDELNTKSDTAAGKMEKVQQQALQGAQALVTQIDGIITSAIDETENAAHGAMQTLVMTALEYLKYIIEIAITGTTAMGVLKSSVNPLEVVKTLGKIAVIEAAFAATKGLIKQSMSKSSQSVKQAYGGHYDVIGAEDSQKYTNVPSYGPISDTGIINQGRPTLVNEQGGEIIVDADTTKNIQLRAPEILSAINEMRVPQKAAGNVESSNGQTGFFAAIDETIKTNKQLQLAIQDFNATMGKIKNGGIQANYTDKEVRTIEERIKRMDNIRRGNV